MIGRTAGLGIHDEGLHRMGALNILLKGQMANTLSSAIKRKPDILQIVKKPFKMYKPFLARRVYFKNRLVWALIS